MLLLVTGNMGGKMAQNLLKAGLNVYGFDLSETAVTYFTEAGGIACDSPQAAARTADVVITMLPAAKHVRMYIWGKMAFWQYLRRVVYVSTVAPLTHKQLKILQQVQQKEITICDAPVSGGTIGAQAGTLTFMVGTDEATFIRVKTVLSPMGKNMVHCGDVGAGQIAKICNNLILGISMAAVAEGMALGVKLGIDPQALAGVINSSSGRCWSSEVLQPLARYL